MISLEPRTALLILDTKCGQVARRRSLLIGGGSVADLPRRKRDGCRRSNGGDLLHQSAGPTPELHQNARQLSAIAFATPASATQRRGRTPQRSVPFDTPSR
jgi:hypothetical protein